MVSRRLKEMCGLEMIYNTQLKSLTSRGRSAYDYSIRTSETVVPIPEKFDTTQTTTADYASMLLANTKGGRLKQQELFEDV